MRIARYGLLFFITLTAPNSAANAARLDFDPPAESHSVDLALTPIEQAHVSCAGQ
jgi:hypothetical protein